MKFVQVMFQNTQADRLEQIRDIGDVTFPIEYGEIK